MAQYVFGTGPLIIKRLGATGAGALPAHIGVVTDFSLDIERKVEELVGQYEMAVALGGGQLSVKGTLKFAQLQAVQLNNLLLDQTLTANSALRLVSAEPVTVSSGAATVANGSTFVEDLGVFTADNVQLSPVDSGAVSGVSYVPGASNDGEYTFASGDNGKSYLVHYSYLAASGQKITTQNRLMGAPPNFSMYFQTAYNYLGTLKTLTINLPACVGGKFSLPMNNQKFAMVDFDFSAQAGADGQWGTFSFDE